MLTKRIAITFSAVVIALAVAPAAQGAGELTRKQAKRAVEPVAKELVATVAPAIAAKLPGATVSSSRVAECNLQKRRRRAVCVISFTVQGAQTGETECVLDAAVRRNSRSRKLEVGVGRTLICLFTTELP